MQEITITYATQEHFEWLEEKDRHITPSMLKSKVSDKQVLIVQINGQNIGWLRFGFLWDMVPFVCLVSIEEEYRKKGVGKKLVNYWEEEMKQDNHKLVMTSTQADEEGQYFWRKMGYHDMGALFELNDGPVEIFLLKKINN